MFKSLRDYSNPNSLGSKLRRKRFKYIEELVRQVLSNNAECKIVDVGGTANYWNLMTPALLAKCRITISNVETIKWGADPKESTPKLGVFDFHCGDGRDLREFETNEFDIYHSNSVIEHVGNYDCMSMFAAEARRVGRLYYVQTPNLWFPIEPHIGAPLLHWLPKPLRAKLMTQFDIGFHKRFTTLSEAYSYVDFIELINSDSMLSLFPNGYLIKERFLLLPKSLISIGPKDKLCKQNL
jgi:hypothetical protein